MCVLLTDTLDYWQLLPKVLTSEKRGKQVWFCNLFSRAEYSVRQAAALLLHSRNVITNYDVSKNILKLCIGVYMFANVLSFKKNWDWTICQQEIISRLGRWIDFDNDYKSMYPWYMESIWWVFKQLYNKGLVYRGYKVGRFSLWSCHCTPGSGTWCQCIPGTWYQCTHGTWCQCVSVLQVHGISIPQVYHISAFQVHDSSILQVHCVSVLQYISVLQVHGVSVL